MNESIHILVVHSDPKVSDNVQKMLRAEGYRPEAAAGVGEALDRLKEDLFHIVLLDAALGEGKQLELMTFINQFCPDTLVIPISWYAMLKSAVEAIYSTQAGEGDERVDLKAMKMTINRLSRSIRGREREKESHKEVLMMAKELQESNRRLMEMDRRKNNCLAVATHELRTPITIVNGYLKLLLSQSFGELNEKQGHLVRESSKYCGRLIDLVNSMLDRCRLESGATEFEYRNGSYLDRLRKIVTQMEDYVKESGLSLTLDIPEEEVLLSFDPNAIEQTLINLIGNAVKFTPSPGEIKVRCETGDDGVLTQVIDTGVGIEAQEIEKVFDEFNSVGRKHGDKKGAGLGLSICKRIIEAHHGEIWVESEAGKGACFSFRLPQNNVVLKRR